MAAGLCLGLFFFSSMVSSHAQHGGGRHGFGGGHSQQHGTQNSRLRGLLTRLVENHLQDMVHTSSAGAGRGHVPANSGRGHWQGHVSAAGAGQGHWQGAGYDHPQGIMSANFRNNGGHGFSSQNGGFRERGITINTAAAHPVDDQEINIVIENPDNRYSGANGHLDRGITINTAAGHPVDDQEIKIKIEKPGSLGHHGSGSWVTASGAGHRRVAAGGGRGHLRSYGHHTGYSQQGVGLSDRGITVNTGRALPGQDQEIKIKVEQPDINGHQVGLQSPAAGPVVSVTGAGVRSGSGITVESENGRPGEDQEIKIKIDQPHSTGSHSSVQQRAGGPLVTLSGTGTGRPRSPAGNTGVDLDLLLKTMSHKALDVQDEAMREITSITKPVNGMHIANPDDVVHADDIFDCIKKCVANDCKSFSFNWHDTGSQKCMLSRSQDMELQKMSHYDTYHIFSH